MFLCTFLLVLIVKVCLRMNRGRGEVNQKWKPAEKRGGRDQKKMGQKCANILYEWHLNKLDSKMG